MNKASGGDGSPAVLFQILKDDVVKCCTQYTNKFGKLSSGHNWKKSVFIPNPKKGNAKESSNYHTIALISQASTEKAMAIHSSTPAWKIPWTEEPGRLQSMGLLRDEHD